MGESTEGDSEGMPWQDVSRKRKDSSNSSGSSSLGLGVSDVSKKPKAAKSSVRREDEGMEWKVMVTFKRERGTFSSIKVDKSY